MGSTVKDVMTTQVVAVRKAASFKEMVIKMRDSRIGAFPVLDDGGRVIGVVSAADMLNKEADLAVGPGTLSSLLRLGDREKAAGVTAAELMTSPAVTIGSDAPLAEAVLEEADPVQLITAIVEPEVTDDLVPAVTAAGAHGLTAAEVIGLGRAHGQPGAVRSAACAGCCPEYGSTLSCRTTRLTPWSAPSQNARIPE